MEGQTPENPNGVAGKPLNPQVTPNHNAYDSLQAANEPLAQPEKYNIQKSIDELHNQGPIQQLRTYESDVADAMKSTHATVAKVVIAQQKKEEKQKPPEFAPAPKKTSQVGKNTFLLAVSLLLVIAGLAALGTFIYAFMKHEVPVQNPTLNTAIINVDTVHSVRVLPEDNLFEVIRTAMQNSKPGLNNYNLIQGSTTASKIQNETLSIEEVMTRLAPNAPSWLARSLKKDYVIGSSNNSSYHPFIILKTDSYENGFSGMLKWESTIASDLQPLLETASTTPLTGTFKDVVIKNKDVRHLSYGTQDILFYSLPDKDTIIITTDEATLIELFNRLTATKFTQ